MDNNGVDCKGDKSAYLSKIYCVYDSKAEHFGSQPFFCPNRAAAIRGFEQACNDPQQDFCKWPADFTLFEIGTWDTRTGEIKMFETKISLGLAVEFKKSDSNPKLEVVR